MEFTVCNTQKDLRDKNTISICQPEVNSIKPKLKFTSTYIAYYYQHELKLN